MAEVWDMSEALEEHPDAVGYFALWGGSNWDDVSPVVHPPTPLGREAAYAYAESREETYLPALDSEDAEGLASSSFAEAHAAAAPLRIGSESASGCILCTCCDWRNHAPKIRLVHKTEGVS